MTTYLSAVSFEDRCIALPTEVPPATNGDAFILLDFDGYEDVAPYVFNRLEMERRIAAKNYRLERIPCHIDWPLRATEQFEKTVARFDRQDVVVDISALPRNYLFTIARRLALLDVPTKFVYYRPETYGVELSRGARFITPIAGFEGDASISGDTELTLVLGYEGYKAMYAWERVGPTKVMALLGDPPYQPEFLETARANNQELLSMVDIEQDGLHTFDVIAARDKIGSVFADFEARSKDGAFVLCPLGTKPQSLACFAFAYRHPKASVVYVASDAYFTEQYSGGYATPPMQISMQELIG